METLANYLPVPSETIFGKTINQSLWDQAKEALGAKDDLVTLSKYAKTFNEWVPAQILALAQEKFKDTSWFTEEFKSACPPPLITKLQEAAKACVQDYGILFSESKSTDELKDNLAKLLTDNVFLKGMGVVEIVDEFTPQIATNTELLGTIDSMESIEGLNTILESEYTDIQEKAKQRKISLVANENQRRCLTIFNKAEKFENIGDEDKDFFRVNAHSSSTKKRDLFENLLKDKVEPDSVNSNSIFNSIALVTNEGKAALLQKVKKYDNEKDSEWKALPTINQAHVVALEIS